jgi:pyruvyl transferase EpsO
MSDQSRENTLDGPANVKAIEASLRASLQPLQGIGDCVLLEYRRNPNVGIHLLWLGTVVLLHDVLQAKVKYVASASDFSGDAMAAQAPGLPIVIRGGVLSDVWDPRGDRRVGFLEQLVDRYHDRPICFLPHALHFSHPEHLKTLAAAFNAHPALTFCAREERSYRIALEHFPGCRVLLMPDVAFALVSYLDCFPARSRHPEGTLFLRRTDRPGAPALTDLGLPRTVTEDWDTCPERSGHWLDSVEGRCVRLARYGMDCLSRVFPRPLLERLDPGCCSAYNRRSFEIARQGARQISPYRAVVTDRLHAHILCTLMGIPNVVIPGPHPLVEALYRTWTHRIPFCRFVSKPSDVPQALTEVLATAAVPAG